MVMKKTNLHFLIQALVCFDHISIIHRVHSNHLKDPFSQDFVPIVNTIPIRININDIGIDDFSWKFSWEILSCSYSWPGSFQKRAIFDTISTSIYNKTESIYWAAIFVDNIISFKRKFLASTKASDLISSNSNSNLLSNSVHSSISMMSISLTTRFKFHLYNYKALKKSIETV